MTISRAQMGSQLTGNRMPVKKVKGGYKFGSSGKVYPTRAGAERQQRAAYANGYRGMAAGGKVPSGYHRMPDGSIMKDSAHKMGHGGKVPTGSDAKDLEICRMGKGGKTKKSKSRVNEAGNSIGDLNFTSFGNTSSYNIFCNITSRIGSTSVNF